MFLVKADIQEKGILDTDPLTRITNFLKLVTVNIQEPFDKAPHQRLLKKISYNRTDGKIVL